MGFIPFYADIAESIRKRKIYLNDYSDSPGTNFIKLLANRIIKVGDERIENSKEKIIADGKKVFGK